MAGCQFPFLAAFFQPGLQSLKDSRKGERCFIIGNGPSLRQTDLSRLKGEATFGMNRFYLAFPEIGFQTTYYLSVNDLVIEQCADGYPGAGDAQVCFLASAPLAESGGRPVFPLYQLYRPAFWRREISPAACGKEPQ